MNGFNEWQLSNNGQATFASMPCTAGTTFGGGDDSMPPPEYNSLKSSAAMTADEMQSRIASKKREEMEKVAAEEAREAARLKDIAESTKAAKAAFAAGSYEEAERQFGIALMNQPENRVDLLCNRAACCIKLERFADAVADAGEATDFEPSSHKAFYRLACAYRGMGSLAKALTAAQKGLKLAPSNKQFEQLVEELGGHAEEEVAAVPVAAAPAAPQQQEEEEKKGQSESEKALDLLKAAGAVVIS